MCINIFKWRVIYSSMKQFIARVLEIKQLTPEVKHITLSAPDGFTFLPGQFVSIIFTHEGKELRRPYSIASKTQGTIELCMKDVGGPCSLYLRTISVGDEITLLGPLGRFLLPPGDLVFISTGVGVAPFRPMIHHALSEGRNVTLIAGYRTEQDVLYHDEFSAYHKNFKYLVCISRPKEDVFAQGYVQDMLGEIPDSFTGQFLICGILPMIQDVSAALIARGVDTKRIHTERFT